jgi:hypothetical protein
MALLTDHSVEENQVLLLAIENLAAFSASDL